jgi:hypothetical protein
MRAPRDEALRDVSQLRLDVTDLLDGLGRVADKIDAVTVCWDPRLALTVKSESVTDLVAAISVFVPTASVENLRFASEPR